MKSWTEEEREEMEMRIAKLRWIEYNFFGTTFVNTKLKVSSSFIRFRLPANLIHTYLIFGECVSVLERLKKKVWIYKQKR